MRLSSFFRCVDAMRAAADYYGRGGFDVDRLRQLIALSYHAQGFYAGDRELFYDDNVLTNPAIYPQYVRPPFQVCFVHYRVRIEGPVEENLTPVPDRAALVVTTSPADGSPPGLYLAFFDRFYAPPPKQLAVPARRLLTHGWVFNPFGVYVHMQKALVLPPRSELDKSNEGSAWRAAEAELYRETPPIEWVGGLDTKLVETQQIESGKKLIAETFPEVRTFLSFFAFLNCDNTAEYVRAEAYRAKNNEEARRLRKYPGIAHYRIVSLPAPANGSRTPITDAGEERRRALARAHFRRGHYREYKPGAVTWVKPCRVNLGRPFVDKHYVLN